MELVAHPSADALTQAVEALLRTAFTAPYDAPSAVMLSGGRTPLPAYASLSKDPPAAAPRLRIVFSDERHVAPDSPEHNQGNARPMLAALELDEAGFIEIPTGGSLESDAGLFEQRLADFIAQGGRFPLAILGIGDDGHTCSLFTSEDLASAEGRLAIPVRRPEGPHRISVTPDILRCVERVVVLAAGEEKAAIVAEILSEPERVTAGVALRDCARVEIWTA